jgi:branched-chain amino acid transport system ATP-binding protein
MSLLTVDHVARHFGGVVAVEDAAFSIEAGTVFGLIGPNGAGKTTVVNLITGYFTPTRGEISFDGQNVRGVAPYKLARRHLARTFQNLQLFEGVTVLDNVLIGRHLSFTDKRWQLLRKRHRNEKAQRAKAMELLEQLDLASLADADASALPYGVRRRVEIARALAVEPKMLLLDEPTAGMTRKESDDIGELIKTVNAAGVTVLLVDHNVRLVTDVCHRVAVMDWGVTIFEGTPREVWANQEVRDAYLGSGRSSALEDPDLGVDLDALAAAQTETLRTNP